MEKTLNYKQEILKVLDHEKIKSTNEIMKALQEKTKRKFINWHLLYRHLRDLAEQGKVEKLEAVGGLFWRKK